MTVRPVGAAARSLKDDLCEEWEKEKEILLNILVETLICVGLTGLVVKMM